MYNFGGEKINSLLSCFCDKCSFLRKCWFWLFSHIMLEKCVNILVRLGAAGVLLCRMSNPGGCVRPSMMSLRVSGVVSSTLASSSTLLVLTLLSTHCRRQTVPVWSAFPPTKDRNLNRNEKYRIQSLEYKWSYKATKHWQQWKLFCLFAQINPLLLFAKIIHKYFMSCWPLHKCYLIFNSKGSKLG